MSTGPRYIFSNGSSIAVRAAGSPGPPIDGPMGDDMADAFAYAAASAMAPKSLRESAAGMLASISARGFGQAMFHAAEALRLAFTRPRRAKMRRRPGLYTRPKMKRAERAARNFAASAMYSAAAISAAVGARVLRLPR